MLNIEKLGKRIKEVRRRKKISQEKLADMIEMNQRSITRIESAKTIPSLLTLSKISKALEINVLDLFDTEPQKTADEYSSRINDVLIKLSDKDKKIILDIMLVLFGSYL